MLGFLRQFKIKIRPPGGSKTCELYLGYPLTRGDRHNERPVRSWDWGQRHTKGKDNQEIPRGPWLTELQKSAEAWGFIVQGAHLIYVSRCWAQFYRA